jgi:hypothetical protein
LFLEATPHLVGLRESVEPRFRFSVDIPARSFALPIFQRFKTGSHLGRVLQKGRHEPLHRWLYFVGVEALA